MTQHTCTCWRFATTDGRVLPLTYACLHDEIQVRSTSGEVAQGFSTGVDWIETPDARVGVLAIDGDGRELVFMLKEDIETVTPVGGFVDRQVFIGAVMSLIDSIPVGEPEHYLQFVAGDHETVQVTVKRERHRCAPW